MTRATATEHAAPPAAAPVRLALLLLCHESPHVVARQLSLPFYRHPDVTTYLHYDARRPASDREELRRRLPADGRFVVLGDPLRCAWGDHTLVRATQRLLDAALADADFAATHFVLLSASCVPYRPVASLQAFLQGRPGVEFIEAVDIGQRRWVKDGLEAERFQLYFPFNYRSHRRQFEWLTNRQQEFRIRRRLPADVRPHFGSQWWCLTRPTAGLVNEQLRRPDLQRWIRWSWIPDEFAIQTLVANHCAPGRIAGHNLTYYEFDHNGQPVVLENDHWDHLLAQPFFFARKVAPEARGLHARVSEHTSRPEDALDYFGRVGRATADYARFLAGVESRVGPRAHVGTVEDPWRGPLDTNRRRYYVLRASSREWLLALLRQARGQTRLPLFDLPFDRDRPRIAGEGAHLGFAPDDSLRRDHDPAAYLLELVQCDPEQPSAFGLDWRRGGWVRDFVRYDRRATVIDCDPPLSREQRAALALRDLDRSDDGELLRQFICAMRDGAPLPDEGVLQQDRACQVALLRELGPDLGDATLLALRQAFHALDPAPHHIEAGAAWRQFWK